MIVFNTLKLCCYAVCLLLASYNYDLSLSPSLWPKYCSYYNSVNLCALLTNSRVSAAAGAVIIGAVV